MAIFPDDADADSVTAPVKHVISGIGSNTIVCGTLSTVTDCVITF